MALAIAMSRQEQAAARASGRRVTGKMQVAAPIPEMKAPIHTRTDCDDDLLILSNVPVIVIARNEVTKQSP